ncbi:MAG: hypothetical protein M3P53_06355 [Actinomycetota bacterium]|nr:hypothetical protein [Actinomycetota bacterium]
MWRYLYRRAQLKGLFGGSRAWTVLWAVIFVRRMLRKAGRGEAETVYSEALRPGEQLVITHERHPPKGRRR